MTGPSGFMTRLFELRLERRVKAPDVEGSRAECGCLQEDLRREFHRRRAMGLPPAHSGSLAIWRARDLDDAIAMDERAAAIADELRARRALDAQRDTV
jgi:hypothetical protein